MKSKEAKSIITAFNEKYKTGQPVRYWSGLKEGEGVESRTRSVAWMLCGIPVVSVEGRTGGVALTHIEIITPA